MADNEETPFVIDFKQRKHNNYGAAMASKLKQPLPGSDPAAPGVSGMSNVKGSSSSVTAPILTAPILTAPNVGSALSVISSDTAAGLSSAHVCKNSNRPDDAVVKSPSLCVCLHGTSHIEVRDHCHRQRSEGIDTSARRKLIIASILCLLFMICEIIGGVLSNSLAIATDAAHLLTDFASFMISLFAIWIAGRPSTQRMSFGWYRAEVIGAVASVMMIWVITAILVWVAIQRLISQDFELDAKIMLITSGLAILVNIIMGCQLQHGHSHGAASGHAHGDKKKKDKKTMAAEKGQQEGELPRPASIQPPTADKVSGTLALDGTSSPASPPPLHLDIDVDATTSSNGQIPALALDTYSYQNAVASSELHSDVAAVLAETAPGAHHHGGAAAHDAENINVRAAYIHVLGDMVQSVGVFVAALVIFFRPDWVIVDPICTFIFSIIVLYTTFNIMKDALLVLMEGTPNYMHYAEVLETFYRIEGVQRVHNLRIWALSINKIALSVHLAIGPGANPKKILQEATTAVHLRYNFFETTIQIEDFTPNMENCQQCSVPLT